MKTISRFGLFLLSVLVFSSGASAYRQPNIRAIRSPLLQKFVNLEAKRILAVTPNAGLTSSYRFYLAHLRKRGWAGLSFGNHVIYLDYSMVKAGFLGTRGLKRFRMVLAHEIGHDVAGHRVNKAAIANVFNAGRAVGQGTSSVQGIVGIVVNLIGHVALDLYGRSAELEADRLGIEYWKRLGWNCKEWVYSFERGLDSGAGDYHHPPVVRLRQAADLCLPPNEKPRIDTKVKQYEAKLRDERAKLCDERMKLLDEQDDQYDE